MTAVGKVQGTEMLRHKSFAKSREAGKRIGRVQSAKRTCRRASKVREIF